jgi:hypothetical protein
MVVSALSSQYFGSSPHDYLETKTQAFSISSCLSAHSGEDCIFMAWDSRTDTTPWLA